MWRADPLTAPTPPTPNSYRLAPADAAIDTVAATGRIGVRIVTRTVRFVARHPREVLIGVGLVAVCLGVLRLVKSSQQGDAD